MSALLKLKLSSRLGMIKRWSKEFNDPHVTKSLYVSLVRSILEYNSGIWCPYYNCHITSLESFQRKFSSFALRGQDVPEYEIRLLLLELNTLEDRRKMSNVTFMSKLLGGAVDCPDLLEISKLRCPTIRLRNITILKTSSANCNYVKYQPFNVICEDFSDLNNIFDFNLSLNNLQNILYLYFRNKMQLTVMTH